MPISLASIATAPRILSRSAASTCSASGRPSGNPSVALVGVALVKIALQDELCGNLIAYAFVRARFHSRIGQRGGGGVSGEAFVDELRRETEATFELLGEPTRTRGQGVLRAVGMQRQADDQQRGMPFVDQGFDRREAGLVLLARDSCPRLRRPDGALAYRDADAPGAEIERENGPRARGAGGCRPDHASRVPDSVGQSRKIDAQQFHRRRQAGFGGGGGKARAVPGERKPTNP